VWAWAAPEAAGRRASEVVGHLFVQEPVVLRETRLLLQRTVVLAGMDGWPDAQGFAVRAIDCSENRGVAWRDVGDGKVALPWIVGDSAFVEVFAVQKGMHVPLARVRVGANDPAELRIELPAKRHVTLWVRDGPGGAPCAGAEVFRLLGTGMHAAGTTDAGGKLELDVADVPDASTLVFARGAIAGIAMPIDDRMMKLTALAPDYPAGAHNGDLFANLGPGSDVHIRVVRDGGGPLAGAELACDGMATNRRSRSSVTYGPWSRSVVTDANGECCLVGVAAQQVRFAHLLLREPDYAALPAAWRSGLVPVVFAPLVGQPGTGAADAPIVLDLGRMCPIELRAVEPGGEPAAGADFYLVCLDPYGGGPWGPQRGRLLADRRGCVRICVPAAKHIGFTAVSGMSLLIRAFETSAGHRDAGPAVGTFRLPPPTSLHGRLLDPAGAPRLGREVFAMCWSPANHEQFALSWTSEPAASTSDPHQNVLRVLLPEAESELRFLCGLISRPVITDTDGAFAVPLPAQPLPFLSLHGSDLDTLEVQWSGDPQTGLEWRTRR
jgi:hypothetical protein